MRLPLADRLRALLRPPAAPGSSDADLAALDAASAKKPTAHSATGSRGAAPSGGVPREVLRQVRLIELRTRGWVESLFGGEYHSIFKGQGMEFMEVREYQPGDDIRNIDWNVTARIGMPFLKKHVEERELTVLLAIDLSASGQFGTRGRFKAELAAEIAAVLALSAVRNNDRVGLLIFTDQVEHFVPPRKGQRHALRLIRDVLAFRPRSTGTDIDHALDYAGRVLRHRAIIFVLSDFLHPAPPANIATAAPTGSGGANTSGFGVGTPFERTLRLIARRHDLVAITITDAAEEVLPDAGLLAVVDPETGQEWVADTGSPGLRTLYTRDAAAAREALRRLFRRLGVDEIEVRTDASYITPLLGFFRKRDRQLKR